MIWQQPWAWVAAGAVLLPLLIHLLGFGRAPRHRFPTLRFVQTTRFLPTRRTRLHDPWLLLLRVLIVLGAVAALAQPLFRTAERRATYAASLARVVVLDTSASVQRGTVRAGWSVDSARNMARGWADSADVSIVLETADIETAIVGATHWLGTHALRREIVVMSDFQLGALDTSLVHSMASQIGLRFIRLGELGATAGALPALGAPGSIPSAPAMDSLSPSPLLLTSGSGAALSRAVLEAMRRVGRSRNSANTRARMDRWRDIAIVSADYERRDSVLASAAPMQSAWMIRLLHEVRSHPLVAGLAARDARFGHTIAPDLAVVSENVSESAASSTSMMSTGTSAATTSTATLLSAAQGVRDGRPLLLLLLPPDAAPALMLAVLAALHELLPGITEQGSFVSPEAELLELETGALPDSVLRAWQRAPALEPSENGAAFSTEDAPSDARWLWVLVLVLLGAEAIVRRRVSHASGNGVTASSETAKARAA